MDQITISIDELVFLQREVDEEGVELYASKLAAGEPLDPLYGRYCVHTDQFYVLDGAHRSYASYFRSGKKEIELRYENCSKLHMYELNKTDPCIIKDGPFSFKGSINDLVLVDEASKEMELN
ncbi:MAG: hypothetical protein KC535_03800 [Nanoarchaeota archaeon]|nr:hypothetical protein [Nanoarchaeota archaeon]